MISLGSDHAGLELKEEIKKHLTERKIDFKDCGTYDANSVDYPDIAKKACETVTSGECELVMLFCGTGVGMSICANKIKGIRCCVCSDTYSAKMSRMHNDANALAIGGRVVGVELAKEIVNAFLDSKFLGDKHKKRVQKINALEK